MKQEILFALTIWQPWAHFLVTGAKRVENRDWPPPKALVGQWIAIHAGKRYDKSGAYQIRAELDLDVPAADALPASAIVAVAVLDRVVTEDNDGLVWDDPWFVGAFGWYLRDVTPIEPVPCPGARKLWVVRGPARAQVRARFLEARARMAATFPVPGVVRPATPSGPSSFASGPTASPHDTEPMVGSQATRSDSSP